METIKEWLKNNPGGTISITFDGAFFTTTLKCGSPVFVKKAETIEASANVAIWLWDNKNIDDLPF